MITVHIAVETVYGLEQYAVYVGRTRVAVYLSERAARFYLQRLKATLVRGRYVK